MRPLILLPLLLLIGCATTSRPPFYAEDVWGTEDNNLKAQMICKIHYHNESKTSSYTYEQILQNEINNGNYYDCTKEVRNNLRKDPYAYGAREKPNTSSPKTSSNKSLKWDWKCEEIKRDYKKEQRNITKFRKDVAYWKGRLNRANRNEQNTFRSNVRKATNNLNSAIRRANKFKSDYLLKSCDSKSGFIEF